MVVSRIWQLPAKHGTDTLLHESVLLGSVDALLPGDVMDATWSHVMMFDSFATNGIYVYESTGSNNFDRVVYNYRPWSALSRLRARRYSNVCAVAPPSTPTGLTASASSSTQILLSWQDPGGEKDGYHVYSADATLITATSNLNVKVEGLTPCTVYGFYVKAYKGVLESAASNTASTRTATPPQTGEVSGRVKSMAGSPISGAGVSAPGGAQGMTDTSGMYAVCGVPAGLAHVIAVKEGYNSASADVAVAAGSRCCGPRYCADVQLSAGTVLG